MEAKQVWRMRERIDYKLCQLFLCFSGILNIVSEYFNRKAERIIDKYIKR